MPEEGVDQGYIGVEQDLLTGLLDVEKYFFFFFGLVFGVLLDNELGTGLFVLFYDENGVVEELDGEFLVQL